MSFDSTYLLSEVTGDERRTRVRDGSWYALAAMSAVTPAAAGGTAAERDAEHDTGSDAPAGTGDPPGLPTRDGPLHEDR